jgi:hypothetical protein
LKRRAEWAMLLPRLRWYANRSERRRFGGTEMKRLEERRNDQTD